MSSTTTLRNIDIAALAYRMGHVERSMVERAIENQTGAGKTMVYARENPLIVVEWDLTKPQDRGGRKVVYLTASPEDAKAFARRRSLAEHQMPKLAYSVHETDGGLLTAYHFGNEVNVLD